MKELPLAGVAACAALIAVSACTSSGVRDAVTPDDPQEAMSFSANVEKSADDVTVDTVVSVKAEHGSISKVTLAGNGADGRSKVKGRVSGGEWVASERLEPGTEYKLRVSGEGDDGEESAFKRAFSTEALNLDQQTYPSVAPLQGETVGVGMPVIVTFDVPVENRAVFERNMQVESKPSVEGSWNWLSDREAHFRPKDYWKAGTDVTVRLNVNGLPAGGGVYGQQDQLVDFTIGRKVVSTVNISKHELRYTQDGKKVRTIPVSTGDSGHRTREGTKIIMEKFSAVDMDAATTGVDSEDPGYYDLKDVRWAMRVTNSGEFLHAAPWSVGSQGSANVSHGCTGMSTSNADWLFHHSRRGDVVEFVNSPRQLEDRNGWTDWNVGWKKWKAGSALAS